MTKAQKKMFKRIRSSDRSAFVEFLQHQQQVLGGFGHWRELYARKCRKKGVEPPAAVDAS